MILFHTIRFHISITVAIVIITMLAALVLGRESTSLIFLIFLAGYTGGIINSYLRVKVLSVEEIQLKSIGNRLAIIQVYVSPLVSGIFGLVFYGFCLTNLVAGGLFPSFSGLEKNYESIYQIFIDVKPAAQIDAIKAILWGFIAGFSERLVPNVLDNIGKDLK